MPNRKPKTCIAAYDDSTKISEWTFIQAIQSPTLGGLSAIVWFVTNSWPSKSRSPHSIAFATHHGEMWSLGLGLQCFKGSLTVVSTFTSPLISVFVQRQRLRGVNAIHLLVSPCTAFTYFEAMLGSATSSHETPVQTTSILVDAMGRHA